MESGYILKAEGVDRVFRSGSQSVQALRGISLEIAPAQLVVLRGRSGSGKTTLINILGALDYPTEGQVFFMDQNITEMGERDRDKVRRTEMGFVFQTFALLPLMSAYENVEFGLRIAGVPAKERKERAEECLSFVGLHKRMDHRPFEMSGGEQQRVAIARAIAHRPKLILADEPTAELDSKMGLQVMKLFSDLVEKEGITVVATSHDPSVIDIADHVFELEDGQIVNS